MHNKHTISVFEGTLNGWGRPQNDTYYNIKQPSLFFELQENLYRYEDSNKKAHKFKGDI